MSYQSGLPIRFKGVSFVTATLGGGAPQLGQETFDADGNKYVFVYNDCNSQILPTYGVAPQSGVSTPFSVTVSTVTSADILVGVVKHATIPAASYGWVLTRGVTQVEMLATVATNAPLEIGADGLFAPVSNTTGNGPTIGKSLAEIVTNASGSAFIRAY